MRAFVHSRELFLTKRPETPSVCYIQKYAIAEYLIMRLYSNGIFDEFNLFPTY